MGFRVGGGALVAGVGKGVGKSGVVAMAVEGASDEARQCSPEYLAATCFERVALLGAWMDQS